jgi:hypothetical protein
MTTDVLGEKLRRDHALSVGQQRKSPGGGIPALVASVPSEGAVYA